MKSLKEQLFEKCLAYTEHRIASLNELLKEIQQSANEETKSTAGDKYETGRAMAQLEIDKYRGQLAEVVKMKQELSRIPTTENAIIIRPGSLVFTSRGNFYIAITTGQQQAEGQIFFTVSSASPIAQKLIGLKTGDTLVLNNQQFVVLNIL